MLDLLAGGLKLSPRYSDTKDKEAGIPRITSYNVCYTKLLRSALANDIALSLHKLNPERPVEFSIAAGQTAIGDRSLLRVVLENLLGNAWKYTRDQDPARIVFDAVTRENGQRLFSYNFV